MPKHGLDDLGTAGRGYISFCADCRHGICSGVADTQSNRLAREKSPYLLQHAHNPVDWFPWGDDAFRRAHAEDRPIFLSIGYSTCHWCHVMERESFEDEAVARFLNEHFVSIKVDREERPDVDHIYMTFVQATTGSGGWPLNVFLAPDLKPFFGGTYFPPAGRSGRPGFLQLLQQIAGLWHDRRSEIASSAIELHARLKAAAATAEPGGSPLTADPLRKALAFCKRMYDPQHGGFGDAPKFPQPALPALLLRCARRFGDAEAAAMVLATCRGMAAGGIHDQLGGGFARYSVDAEWRVPHFEKMLYDNAQLANLYLDAHLVATETARPGSPNGATAHRTPSPPARDPGVSFAAVARDVLDYVLRDMTHPDGGFYSAEDADSEGHEGKFYCWTLQELQALLTADELPVVSRHFGITGPGNFIDHSHPTPLPNQNVLSIVDPRLTEEEARLLDQARKKMFAARARRVRPHRDDKILASWNGLMLGAMARAAAILGDPKYRVAAERNLAFVREKLWDARTQTLYHRWRDGERDRVQLSSAYAFLLLGVLDLYETTAEPSHLDFAAALAEALLAKFYDSRGGGFWQGPADAGDLIWRVKDDYDGAEPSGNSAATLALLRLAAITGRREFRAAAEATLQLFARRLDDLPQAMPLMLQALDFYLEEPRRAVVAGDPAAGPFAVLLQAVHSVYQPNKVVLGNRGSVEPFARGLPATNDPIAYLCTGDSCQAPTGDPSKLADLLR